MKNEKKKKRKKKGIKKNPWIYEMHTESTNSFPCFQPHKALEL